MKAKIDYTKVMEERHFKSLQAKLPTVDLDDFTAQQNVDKETRQFAAEYSQDCYDHMV